MTTVSISFAGSSGITGFPAFPPDLAEKLRLVFPETHITLIRDPTQRLVELVESEVLFAVRFSPQDFAAAKRLRWLHLSSAGATHVLFPEMVDSDLLVTNSRGLYGIPIAEHVLGTMLMLARRLHDAYRFQLEGKWPRQEMFERYPLLSELHGRTCGIVGLGSIGLAVAERAKAFGMRVIACKRTTTDKPAGIDELYGSDGLQRLLRQSDFVVIAAPLTNHTHGLIGKAELALMKPSAYLINVGRGAIIDEPALIQALRDGRLAGAGLDVTDPEPPLPDSELFHLPNVLITPHYSGLRSNYWEHAVALFQANLTRYLRGEPLENRVDKRGGY